MLIEKVNQDSDAVKFKDIPIGRAFVEYINSSAYRDQKDDEAVYVKYSNSHAMEFNKGSLDPFSVQFHSERLVELVRITLVAYSEA